MVHPTIHLVTQKAMTYPHLLTRSDDKIQFFPHRHHTHTLLQICFSFTESLKGVLSSNH